jgi:hypothetical protein
MLNIFIFMALVHYRDANNIPFSSDKSAFRHILGKSLSRPITPDKLDAKLAENRIIENISSGQD